MLYDPTLMKQASQRPAAKVVPIGAVKIAPAKRNPPDQNLPICSREFASHTKRLTVSTARLAEETTSPMACLTPSQQQVMAIVLAGHPSKTIAADLHISQRTFENHRPAIMRRTGATSIPALTRLSLGIK